MTRRSLVSRGSDTTQATAVSREIGGTQIFCSSAIHQDLTPSPPAAWHYEQLFGIPFTFKQSYQRVYLSFTLSGVSVTALPDGYTGTWPISAYFVDFNTSIMSSFPVKGVTNGASMVFTNVGDFAAGDYNFGVQLTIHNTEDTPSYNLFVDNAQMQVILGQVVEVGDCPWTGCV
jgi:hypothetical protein